MAAKDNVVDATGTFATIRSAASELVNRSRFARWAGKTFGGDRDVYTSLGYKERLEIQDYRLQYERGGIAATIIEAKPHATWRGFGDVIETDDPEKVTTFEAAWVELNQRLNVWPTFMHADVLAGLGRYSVIFLGAPGELTQPLTSLRSQDLVQLHTFAEDDAVIHNEDLEWNTASARFAMANFYRIKRLSKDGRNDLKVHWSRCIHVRSEGVPDGILFGPPRLRAVWNYLDDLVKVVGGGAESFWVRANQGYVFNLDPTATVTEPQKKEMGDQLDEFVHGMRRMLRLKGVEAKTLGSDVADFSQPVTSIVSLISSVTGIPQRILLGSERGQMASEQDRENWADRIDDRRDQYAHPFIVKPFINHLVALGTLVKPAEFKTAWPDQESLTEGEKADLIVKMTKANQQQGEDIIESDEIRDMIYGLKPLVRDPAARRPAPVVDPNVQNAVDQAIAASRAAASRPTQITVHPPNINLAQPNITVQPDIHLHMPPVTGKAKVISYDGEGRITRIEEEVPA
jgi:hypothetical protein